MQRQVFDNHPITTYSSLINWLTALNMRRAPAKQWLATIKSAKGIRDDEIQRSGLVNFLFEFDPAKKVNKSELLDIAQKELTYCTIAIKTERATTYEPTLQCAAFNIDAIPKKVLESFANAEIVSCHRLMSFNYKVIRLKFVGMFGSNESSFVFDENWRQFKPTKNYKTPVEAIDFLYTVAADKFRKYSSSTPRNHYERFSLQGKNTGYKEWLVSLPYWQDGYDESHFNIMNLIVHLRTSNWKDTNNQPLLLIDEMQSDWHAAWQKHGYYKSTEDINSYHSGEVPDVPFKKEWYELGIKIAIWIALQLGHNRVAFTTGNVHKARYGQDLDGFHLLYDQLIPKVLAKLADKFNCSLNLATIVVSKPTDSMQYKKGTGWELRKHGKDDVQIIKNKVVALRYLKGRGTKKLEEVRVLELSPEINVLIKSKGLPLFGLW